MTDRCASYNTCRSVKETGQNETKSVQFDNITKPKCCEKKK
nr:MAG TPA: hypothetical protein [Caudoviricetes sp.]